MCSSVDLPAPEGATSATDSPGHSDKLGALQDLERRVALPVGALDVVQIDRLGAVLCSTAHRSFVAQRLDRIEPRGPPRRDRAWRGATAPSAITTTAVVSPTSIFGRQLRQEVEFRREQFGAGEAGEELPDRFDVAGR